MWFRLVLAAPFGLLAALLLVLFDAPERLAALC